MKHISLVAFCLLSVGLPAPARANLRAPGMLPSSPSSALKPSEASPGLNVLGEVLRFTCDDKELPADTTAQAPARRPRSGGRVCEVEAVYRVAADKDVTVVLEFVLPVNAAITAIVGSGGAPREVATEPTERLTYAQAEEERKKGTPGTRIRMQQRDEDQPLYRAKFTAPLVAGTNTITVRYDQPLGALERDYGYFKKGRWIDRFTYEVWPITEWTLAPDFRLDLTVSIHREAPGWWKRTFSKVRSIGCDGSGGATRAGWEMSIPGATRVQTGERLVYKVTFPATALPDVLRCSIGDDDLVER